MWEFVNDDSQPNESYVRPVSELPAHSLGGRLVATEVTLRNGKRLLALVGNADVASPRLTRHFLVAL